jgi:predicted aspartyl protease
MALNDCARLATLVVLPLLWIAPTPLHAQRAPAAAPAVDAIEGVQSAALDQPRVYVQLKRSPRGPALGGAGEDGGVFEAFLDTGASGVMLSGEALDRLGVKKEKSARGEEVVFEDVGVGGADKFRVTEQLFVTLAGYPNADQDAGAFARVVGPFRMQVRPSGGLLQLLAPDGLNVAGMPVMVGKVVVMDPTPLTKFDKIRTTVVPPGDRSIPKTSRSVPLTYVSFARFTRVAPAGARGPDLQPNPMIGPDPFNPADKARPVVIRHNGRTATGTFLLDTGAASSMISRAMAEKLGVKVNPDGQLVTREKTFQLTIGGLGGQKEAHGLFFTKMELPTREGKPIAYAQAPLLVADITVADEKGKPFTLDGVLGMNYLVASAEVTGGLLPDIGNIVDGPWRAIVIDHPNKVMGLEPQ